MYGEPRRGVLGRSVALYPLLTSDVPANRAMSRREQKRKRRGYAIYEITIVNPLQ
jgi:hypothetical protein